MTQYNFIAEVPSSNGRRNYTIKVDGSGLFSCNCPSWIFNQRGNRTCKHIDALRTDGMTLDGKGKIITAVETTVSKVRGSGSGSTFTGTGWKNKQKIRIMCKNYPEQCDGCTMRFLCWTQREAELDINQLREAGIYKDR